MTTLAMVLGMLPSAFGVGEGGEFRAPMSLATIGGLMTSTLLTLVVVPVAYLLLDRLLERIRQWRKAPTPAIAKAMRVTTVLVLILRSPGVAGGDERIRPDAGFGRGARAGARRRVGR